MPGLLTLKTNLKSLKYGNDTPGGGSSGQPYITTDINDVDNDFNKFRLTKFDDGLVRGGVVGATNASIVDTIRIGKFFKDSPKGPLFIIKQVGLQLSNPRLEVNKNPLKALLGGTGGILASSTNGLLEPTRIYNLGINTLAQVPVNAFGIHFNRHGILPIQTESSKYESIVINNNEKNNRLIGLKNKFKLGKINFGNQDEVFKLIGNIPGLGDIPFISNFLSSDDLIIDKYLGGPESVYGIGNTIIKRTNVFTEDNQKYKDSLDNSFINTHKTIEITKTFDYAISNKTESTLSDKDFKIPIPDINKYLSYTNVAKYNDIESYNSIEYKNVSSSIISSNNEKVGERLPSSKNNISYVNSYGDKKTFNTKLSWQNGTREVRVGSARQDSINLTPLFREKNGSIGDTITIKGNNYNIRDFAKFRIQAINTDEPSGNTTWMVFRAYLTDLSDDVSAEWQDIKYAGRGDKFYIYSGFTRKMNVSFKVAALSEKEMKPMYQKLNYLMSNLMPDYNNNVMRGPLMRMTIGNYIDGQLCILNSLSYKVSQETPWEIALDEPESGNNQLILPHIIEVSLGFTPIGSQTKEENALPRKDALTSNIAQDWKENKYIYRSADIL